MVQQIHIELPMPEIEAFCKRWAIREFALFGSVLRDDFRPDSDIDVMVTFQDPTRWSLMDRARMQRELASLLGRPVDVIRRDGLEQDPNEGRRRHIIESARVMHAER